MLVCGITCARIARVSLPIVLYACRGGTHCFFGVDFPLIPGVLLACLHLLRVRTSLTLLKILAFVAFLLPAGLSLRVPGLITRTFLLMASWNRWRKFMILIGNITGERGEAGSHLVISGEGAIGGRSPRETALALILGH